MSRYNSTTKDGKHVAYGFDRPTRAYFAQVWSVGGEIDDAPAAETPDVCNNGAMLEFCAAHNIVLRPEHESAIVGDLEF
jgi:hypothetical protein